MCSLNATYKYLPSVEMPGQLSPAIGVPQADNTRSNRRAAPTNRWRGADNTFKRTPSRNRIVASGVKRVAAQYAFKTHPGTFNQTVFVDGLVGVVRTTWFKTARGRQNFREGHLVHSNHSHTNIFHVFPSSCHRSARLNSSSSTPYTVLYD